jgi:hypothetical protein
VKKTTKSDNQSAENNLSGDQHPAVKQRADQKGSEETPGDIEEFATGNQDASELDGLGGQTFSEDALNDEELAALDELVEKVQAPDEETDETDPLNDELLALDQLTEVENSEAKDSGGPAQDLSSLDEELAALEELVEPTPAKKEKRPAGKPALSEEDRALEALMDDGPSRQAASGDHDKGVITLKEVVSLGRVSEQGRVSAEKKKQRLASTGPAGAQKKSSVSLDGGLSEEEQDDLETLIKGFREETSSGVTAAVVTDLQTQIHALQKRVMSLSKMMAKFEGKIQAFGEVIQLEHKKSELMNRRIDRIASGREEE